MSIMKTGLSCIVCKTLDILCINVYFVNSLLKGGFMNRFTKRRRRNGGQEVYDTHQEMWIPSVIYLSMSNADLASLPEDNSFSFDGGFENGESGGGGAERSFDSGCDSGCGCDSCG
jgi:hypothetical protein